MQTRFALRQPLLLDDVIEQLRELGQNSRVNREQRARKSTERSNNRMMGRRYREDFLHGMRKAQQPTRR